MKRFVSSVLFVLTTAVLVTHGCGGSGGTPPDTTPPTVEATDPPPNAIGVQIDDPIVVTFSEQIAPGSVTASSFGIRDDAGQPVAGGVRSGSGRNVRFTPTAGTFVKSKRYEATLTTAITDLAGNALAAPFTFDFTLSTDSWAPTATTGAPVARALHTAVWAGNEMIVWGGFDGTAPLDTGGRYDPNLDAWVAVAAGAGTQSPPARTGHTAVWTGTAMVVWGGELAGGLGPTSTGGSYTPSAGAGTWSATTLTGAPPARAQHTAVWTGSEMIVWGGIATGPMRLNTGGRFNPAGGGSWKATSADGSSGVPTPRANHTAVWTGSEMIVWGGIDSLGVATSGASYNPVTDTWKSIAAAPIRLTAHTAVWTGTEMMVWGGDTLNPQGARYNPTTDVWMLMTTTGAPLPSSGHTAVWTGSEMIVWGGSSGSNRGHAYRPASDTWRFIDNTDPDTPSARTGHSAVWTGDEMIIWGGDTGFLTHEGGRYRP